MYTIKNRTEHIPRCVYLCLVRNKTVKKLDITGEN